MRGLIRGIHMNISKILQEIRNETKAAEDLTSEAMVHIREAERRIDNLNKIMQSEADDQPAEECK